MDTLTSSPKAFDVWARGAGAAEGGKRTNIEASADADRLLRKSRNSSHVVSAQTNAVKDK